MRSNIATQPTEPDILAALRDCYDPEIRANIVELGLVHSISLAQDADAPGTGIPGVPPRFRVHIGLLSRNSGSDTGAQIVALIKNRLAAFPSVSGTQVELLVEPRWTPDHMTPELRERLSLALASNQRQDVLVQIQTAPAKTRK